MSHTGPLCNQTPITLAWGKFLWGGGGSKVVFWGLEATGA